MYMKIKQKGRILELQVESYNPDNNAVVSYAQYLDGDQEVLDQEALAELVEMYQDEIDEEAYSHMCASIEDYTDRWEDV